MEESHILRINEFSLEKHEGEYENWPTTSKLFKHGDYVGQEIAGYYIERQYLLDDGHYFFIISYDCPFEEQCDLLLLDKNYHQIAKRRLMPRYYSSWNFNNEQYLGSNKFLLTFNKNYVIKVTLTPNKIFAWRRISWRHKT